MNEITKVKVGYNLGEIISNLDEVASSVKSYCEDFKGVVVTEDTVADGKQMLANIRKEKKYLDDERKEIKKAWNAPYQEFEQKVKEVLALYDEPIGLINSQVQELEEQRKAKKRETIQSIWESADIPDELTGWFSLEELYNPKWENATFKETAIEKEISDRIAMLKMAHDTVKSLHHPYEEDGLKVLRESKDLQSAMTCMTNLLEQEQIIERRKEEERKRREEEQKRLEEEARQATEAVPDPVPEEPALETPQEVPGFISDGFEAPEDKITDGFEAPEEKIYEVIVNVEEERLTDIKVYLDGLGYFYTVKEV